MENIEQQSPKPSNAKDLKIIFALILVFALGVLATFYFMNEKLETKLAEQEGDFQSQITQQENESEEKLNESQEKLNELALKDCKGSVINGVCVRQSCFDSDVNEMPDDIYIKGNVDFITAQGETKIVADSCTGSGKQLNEKWCYESPEGSGKYVAGTVVRTCENGCFDGACVKLD